MARDPSPVVQITAIELLRGEITQPDASTEPAISPSIAAALWAALAETEALFRPTGDESGINVAIHDATTATVAVVRPEFTRQYIGPRSLAPPAPNAAPARASDEVLTRLSALTTVSPSLSWGSSSYAEWQTSRAVTPTASARIVDAGVLGALVQEVVQPTGWTLILTDIELEPPLDWRYIIWRSFPQGAVVSTATLDPRYWREPVESEVHRVLMIKARARAACISVVGSLIGLERCSNPECFLFKDVDSLVRLDDMKFVGPEHDVAELTFRGFGPGDDPAAIQSVDTIRRGGR